MSRESRLLLITIVVCVLALLLLARLRFPQSPIVDSTAEPLVRLAARASYESLAADIERVETLISANLVVLRTAPPLDATPRRLHDVLSASARSTDAPRDVAAVRIDAGTALAALEPGVRIAGIGGRGEVTGTAAVLGIDPVRRLGRIRVPEDLAPSLAPLALSIIRTPAYVVAVEGTQEGLTLRPVFLGRGDPFRSARWPGPLLPLGGIVITPGALLFSLAGEFVGCVVIEDGAPAIAGARDVVDAVEMLASVPSPVPVTAGVAVQTLTPALADALGAPRGVVVSQVDADGAAAGVLRSADVITAVGGRAVDTPDQFLVDVAGRPAGQPVAIAIVRNRALLEVSVVPAAAHEPAAAGVLSIDFVREPGVGTRVVRGREPAGAVVAGLEPGDVVVSAGELVDPIPVRLRRLLDGVAPGQTVVFTVRRGREQRVVAVSVPARGHASRD